MTCSRMLAGGALALCVRGRSSAACARGLALGAELGMSMSLLPTALGTPSDESWWTTFRTFGAVNLSVVLGS